MNFNQPGVALRARGSFVLPVIITVMLLDFRRERWVLQLTAHRKRKATTAIMGAVSSTALLLHYFPTAEYNRASVCVRRPRIYALHVGVCGVFRRRQAKGDGAPSMFEDRRIME